MTANGYFFFFRVIKCSKIDCDGSCITADILKIIKLHILKGELYGTSYISIKLLF